MISPPKVVNVRTPIRVGFASSGGSSYNNIWNVDYDGLLVSEGHRRLKNGRWEKGGPFYVKHRHVSHHNVVTLSFIAGSNPFVATIGGDVRAANISLPAPATWQAVRADASSHYATGYARTRPGNPSASLGQFLIELRDLPKIPLKGLFNFGFKTINVSSVAEIGKALWTRAKYFIYGLPRGAANEYLNIEFGWKPFVSDLRKAYHLMKTIDKQMAQIIRDNGQNIRRRATLMDETNTTRSEVTSGLAWYNWCGTPPTYPNTAGCNPKSTSVLVTRTKTKVWFSGSFRYYIPDVGSWQWDARARAALFGVLPTPDLVWNVLPWSWLIDWFTNVGDVVSNLSPNAVDNLVTNYSFVMKETSVKREYTNTTSYGRNTLGTLPYWDIPAFSGTTHSIDEEITRVRVGGGNPYGLDVPASSLTSRQWSILAALGISRGLVQ